MSRLKGQFMSIILYRKVNIGWRPVLAWLYVSLLVDRFNQFTHIARGSSTGAGYDWHSAYKFIQKYMGQIGHYLPKIQQFANRVNDFL